MEKLIKTTNTVEIVFATNFWHRLLGLLKHPPLHANQGLCIQPCNVIHTFGMRYKIDVLFLDNKLNLCKKIESLAPNRFAYCFRAKLVVELTAGFCKQNANYLGQVQQAFKIKGAICECC